MLKKFRSFPKSFSGFMGKIFYFKLSLVGTYKGDTIIENNAPIESIEQQDDSSVNSHTEPHFLLKKPLKKSTPNVPGQLNWTFSSVFDRTYPGLSEAHADTMMFLGLQSNSSKTIISYLDDSGCVQSVTLQERLTLNFSLTPDNSDLYLKTLPQSEIQLFGSGKLNALVLSDTYSYEDDRFYTDEFGLEFELGENVSLIIGGHNVTDRRYYESPYGLDPYPYGLDRRNVWGKIKLNTFQ